MESVFVCPLDNFSGCLASIRNLVQTVLKSSNIHTHPLRYPLSLMSMYVMAKLCLTLRSRSGLWFQAWKDREDEVTKRGVLSDEEA